MARRIIQLTAASCPSERETEFNEWYNNIHLPMQFKSAGVKKVTRYRLKKIAAFPSSAPPKVIEIDKWPIFLSIFEFDSQEDLQDYLSSDELASATADTRERLTKGGWLKAGVGKKWSAEYELINTWEK